MADLVSVSTFKNQKRYQEREHFIQQRKKHISSGYNSDIKQYQNYCSQSGQPEGLESMLDYLFVSIIQQRVKKNTWVKRLSALKRYFTVSYAIDFDNEGIVLKDIAYIRRLYHNEEYKDLNRARGKQRVNYDDLIGLIIDLPVREKAICLVNLITTSRPSEMVAIKMMDFNFDDNSVSIYLKKQKKWVEKRLNQLTMRAVKEYKSKYKLKDEDYFVGQVLKNGAYRSKQISTDAYRKFLRKMIGLAPYNLRKTQVSSMHDKGADLQTIIKQTGHSSTQTLAEHYLKVSDKTVDKYL